MIGWWVFSMSLLCLSMFILSRHVLNLLLILEMVVMVVLSGILLFVSVGSLSSFMLLLFLFIVICEGCLGIGLLISLIRSVGGDWVSFMSML